MRAALRVLALPLMVVCLGVGPAAAQTYPAPAQPAPYPAQPYPTQPYPAQPAPYPAQPYPAQPPAVVTAPSPPPAVVTAPQRAPSSGQQFSPQEVVDAGHRFFGTVSRGLAAVVEKATSQWGQPNGYILGEEASGAFVGGLRYGEGTLYTKNAGDLRVYWQGPTVGFDWGGEGARTMMLVYNLPATESVYQRFAGIDGSAYFIGGFGMTALTANGVVVVPIRSGVGMRLGANIGYLKFTPQATWNPF